MEIERSSPAHWGGAAAVAALACALATLMLPFSGPSRGQTRLITEFSQDAAVIELPFNYVNHEIVIRGNVGTHKQVNLLFDTGASIPVFDPSVAPQGYNLPDSLVQEAHGTAVARTVVADDLILGEENRCARAHNILSLVADMAQVSRYVGRKIDGIVGLSFISGFVVEIDYAARVLRFRSPRALNIASRIPDERTTFLLELAPADPTLAVTTLLAPGTLAHDYEYRFVLDTGFSGYVSVSNSAAQLSGLLGPTTPNLASESFSLSHKYPGKKIRAASLSIGPINLSNRIVQIDTRNGDEMDQTGIVGNRLLQNYRVILDAGRRRVWLERATGLEEPDEADRPVLGLVVRTEHGSIVIHEVAVNSPAARAGLKSGDRISAIAGSTVVELGISAALARLDSPRGAVRLDIERTEDRAANLRISSEILPEPALDWKP